MAKNIPFKLILEKAKDYQADMTRFLRDMVAIPSESCDEKRVVHRIKEEMEKVGFDKVEIDPMGNVLGYIGHGPRLVAMDAHIDTVGIGNIKNWDFDPYEGMETDELIGGRGTSDQEGGMASMVYAGKIIKDLGLEDEYTLLVTGTVQEEDCDGLCWQYIIEQSGTTGFLKRRGRKYWRLQSAINLPAIRLRYPLQHGKRIRLALFCQTL